MSEKIDINVADVETLATISGIGPKLAARIIEYRQTVHPFEEVIELAAVPGISEKMVRGFEDAVTVQDTAVPLILDAPEEHLLLDAPEKMEMLNAPPQPEGLLAAEVAEPAEANDQPAEEEEIVIAEAESLVTAEETENDDEIEPELETGEEEIASIDAEAMDLGVEPEEETAVSPPPSSAPPEIEELPVAAQPSEAMPEPDLMRSTPTAEANDWEANVQRRGCLNTLLGATFGAILGAVLTLAILAALNGGNLNYAETDDAIRQQLGTEIISRTNELNQLSTRVSLVATQEASSNETLQDEFAAANNTLSEEIADNEEIISYLATRSGDLELRLQDVAGAADTFTGFLDGLRGLLDDLEGGTATPTPLPAPSEGTDTATPTPTPTPFSEITPTAETTATAVPPTNEPTRTPQPTATSFTFPTNTPAPQP